MPASLCPRREQLDVQAKRSASLPAEQAQCRTALATSITAYPVRRLPVLLLTVKGRWEGPWERRREDTGAPCPPMPLPTKRKSRAVPAIRYAERAPPAGRRRPFEPEAKKALAMAPDFLYKGFSRRGGGIGRHAVLRWQWRRRASSSLALDTNFLRLLAVRPQPLFCAPRPLRQGSAKGLARCPAGPSVFDFALLFA